MRSLAITLSVINLSIGPVAVAIAVLDRAFEPLVGLFLVNWVALVGVAVTRAVDRYFPLEPLENSDAN